MAVEVLEANKKGMTEEEFVGSLNRIESFLRSIRDHAAAAAKEFARMSGPQLARAKEYFNKRGLLKPRYIDRLVLFGQGHMPAYLALPETSISATLFMKLPETTRQTLQDPRFTVEVAKLESTTTGSPKIATKIKPVGELGVQELKQVLRPGVGIVPAAKQIVVEPPEKQAKVADKDYPVVATIHRIDGNWCLLKGEDSRGNAFAVKANYTMLRNTLGVK
jgi:hypothetical protein